MIAYNVEERLAWNGSWYWILASSRVHLASNHNRRSKRPNPRSQQLQEVLMGYYMPKLTVEHSNWRLGTGCFSLHGAPECIHGISRSCWFLLHTGCNFDAGCAVSARIGTRDLEAQTRRDSDEAEHFHPPTHFRFEWLAGRGVDGRIIPTFNVLTANHSVNKLQAPKSSALSSPKPSPSLKCHAKLGQASLDWRSATKKHNDTRRVGLGLG